MVWPTQFDVKLDYYDAMELPGQQLGASHAATHLDHALNLNINAPAGCQRLTGIIAAIGKTSMNIDTMVHMMAAGMNIAMINMSYETREEHLDTIRMLRQAAKEYSTKINKNYPLGIAALLTRRKIKTGRIADTFGNYVTLKEGDVVRLTTDETYRERCSASTIFVDFYKLGEQLKKGNIICLDHEMIVLKVEIISSTTFTCIVQRGGQLGSWKDVFISNNIFNMPAFSEKDMLDIEMLIQHQAGKPFFITGGVLERTCLKGIIWDKQLVDVTNAILDGATGFVLKDWYNVENLVEAVKLLNNVCINVSPITASFLSFARLVDEIKLPVNAAEACLIACVAAAYQTYCSIIIIPTVTGKTAKAICRLQSPCLFIVLTSKTRIIRMLHTYRGIMPLKYEEQHKKANDDIEERIQYAVEFAVARKFLSHGETYVTIRRGSASSLYCDTVDIRTTSLHLQSHIECPDENDALLF